MSETRRHWDGVYGTRSDDETSWYQERPIRSLELIGAAAPDRSAAIIDIGCGSGVLLRELAKARYSDLTGLDASAVAIDKARTRLGAAADRVAWLVDDITRWSPQRTWSVWHDRAVFHFLTGRDVQDAYIRAMGNALPAGAIAIIATFALDGPQKCSGLSVQRYSGKTMAERLGPSFRFISETPERHVTPKGAVQSFTYAMFERV